MQMTLKAARVNAGYTQNEAAQKIGVTVDTLSNWERGKCFPSVIHLRAILSCYGVEYDDLIFLPSNNG